MNFKKADTVSFFSIIRHIHPEKSKGLSLGLVFQLFEYLALGLGILQISCEF